MTFSVLKIKLYHTVKLYHRFKLYQNKIKFCTVSKNVILIISNFLKQEHELLVRFKFSRCPLRIKTINIARMTGSV